MNLLNIFRSKPLTPSPVVEVWTKKVWGRYIVLDQGRNYKVKLLEINPGHSISYQHHLHRAELWTVVEGKIIMFHDERLREMELGDRLYIPAYSVHGAENSGMVLAKVIEIQCGFYLGEDDIVRHDCSR